MTIFLFLDKCLKALNSDAVKFSDGLRSLEDEVIIDKATYKNLKSVGSSLDVLFGLGKVHKETKNGLQPFRPILSAIGMSTYKLGKFLLPFLTPLSQNE